MGQAPNAELNAGAGQPCPFHSTVEDCPTVISLLSLSYLGGLYILEMFF